MKNVIAMLLLLSPAIATKQEKITVKTERAEIARFNPKMAKIQVRTFKYEYNRTTTALNSKLMLKVPVVAGYKAAIQGYKFVSNEYRFFHVVFDADICSTFRRNHFGMKNLGSCGNFTTECPIAAGSYTVCNWMPDYKRFPPHLVTGQFKIESTFILNSEVAFVVSDKTLIYEARKNS